MSARGRIPAYILAIREIIDSKDFADKRKVVTEKWLEEATPPQEVAYLQAFAIAEQALLTNAAIYATMESLEKGGRAPVFLRGQMTPIQWVAEHGTEEQKKELVEAGKLPESVLDAEVIESEVVPERADA